MVFTDFQTELNMSSAQREVFQSFIENDCTVFRGARAIGKTFLLGAFYCYLKSNFPNYRVAVLAPTVRQTKMVVNEVNKLGYTYNIVSLENFNFTNYDVVLVDEAAHVDSKVIDVLMTLFLNGVYKKLIFCCSGYYSFSNFLRIEYFANMLENGAVITRNYMNSYYDPILIDEAKKLMSENDFRMEYMAEVIWCR